jgi:hypothetical protein
MRPKREKRKRIDQFSSPSIKSTSTYELISPDLEEDDFEEDSGSAYSGRNGRSRGRGEAKKGKQKENELSEDILYRHRSVSVRFYSQGE